MTVDVKFRFIFPECLQHMMRSRAVGNLKMISVFTVSGCDKQFVCTETCLSDALRSDTRVVLR